MCVPALYRAKKICVIHVEVLLIPRKEPTGKSRVRGWGGKRRTSEKHFARGSMWMDDVGKEREIGLHQYAKQRSSTRYTIGS